jgi:NUMOD4 motif
MTEDWLPVPDWAGLYSVSNRFRVRTEPREVTRANGAQFTTQGCIRRLEQRKSGALMCKLRRPGHEQTIHVGRLVEELFGTEAPANNGHPTANDREMP